jgi:hypothetical protein
MATIIKLKRGTTTPTTSNLANGEVAIDTSAKKFYINDNGTIKEIAGSTGDATSPLAGDVRGYTGDGSTTAFTVSSGADVENVLVFINGVYQRPTTDYTVSGTTLTFGTAPASSDAITIKELVEGANIINDTGLVRAYTGDGSTTTYNVTTGKAQEEFLVFINGVYQRPTNEYTVSSGTLTFVTAPVSADVITIKELAEGIGSEILTIADDTSTTTSFNAGDTLTLSGGTGLSSTISGDVVTFAIDNTVVTTTGSQTLTNKTLTSPVISSISNTGTLTLPTSTGTIALTSDIPTNNNQLTNGASYITASSTDTLTNKSGNISQWTNDSGYLTSFTETNDLTAAVTWANVPNANITQSSVTQHQAALSITESQISDLGSYITASSTDTLTNKSISLTNNTISGTTAEFNTALSDGSFATLAGTETLTNKTISGSSNTLSNIGNASLTNSSITINGTAVSLGGSTTISTASTLTIADDTSTTASIDLNSETLTVAGGTGITTSVSGNTLTITGSATQNTFSTINLNDSTNIVADSTTDTLNLDSSGLISITGDASTDTITVGTVSSVKLPFLKADGSSSNVDLQTSGTLADVITNLYIPFTKADGSAVETLVVA